MHPTRIFKSPEELESAWKNYKSKRKEDAKEWPKVQYVGKEGDRVVDYPVLPLTMEGFEIYCYDNHGTVKHYFDNKEGYYEDFGAICSRIRTEIRDHQITGGMTGNFNPSITQRLNNLTEKTDNQNTNVNRNITVEVVKSDTSLSNSEGEVKLE